VLRLPYVTRETPCGVAELTVPRGEAGVPRDTGHAGEVPDGTGGGVPEASSEAPEPGPAEPVTARPVPLQQAPLGRLVTK
jgi:hypothetical protein